IRYSSVTGVQTCALPISLAQGRRHGEELLSLRKAPPLDPYTGPAILAPEAAGVLFHEAVGHRLEGERQNDDKDGRTFKGQIGKADRKSGVEGKSRAGWKV